MARHNLQARSIVQPSVQIAGCGTDEALQHELRLLWRDYALVSDEKLTRGAQALKRRLLTAFRAVPHAA